MGKQRNIRFPDDLEEMIEAAKIEDLRRDFTDEVIYLVTIGLKEAERRRNAVTNMEAIAKRLETMGDGDVMNTNGDFPTVSEVAQRNRDAASEKRRRGKSENSTRSVG